MWDNELLLKIKMVKVTTSVIRIIVNMQVLNREIGGFKVNLITV